MEKLCKKLGKTGDNQGPEQREFVTTIQMIRKCFCARCSMMPLFHGYCGKSVCAFNNWKAVARAARRFVRMDQRQKLFKELDRIHATVKKDHPEFVPTKLPKHWGEMK